MFSQIKRYSITVCCGEQVNRGFSFVADFLKKVGYRGTDLRLACKDNVIHAHFNMPAEVGIENTFLRAGYARSLNVAIALCDEGCSVATH